MALTVFVAVSITEIVGSKPGVATYTFVPVELTATSLGQPSTGTTAVRLSVSVSITKTVPVSIPGLVTYANGAAPATLTNIKITNTVIPRTLMIMSPLRDLLYIITDENGVK